MKVKITYFIQDTAFVPSLAIHFWMDRFDEQMPPYPINAKHFSNEINDKPHASVQIYSAKCWPASYRPLGHNKRFSARLTCTGISTPVIKKHASIYLRWCFNRSAEHLTCITSWMNQVGYTTKRPLRFSRLLLAYPAHATAIFQQISSPLR